jgi:HEAT repeat protein
LNLLTPFQRPRAPAPPRTLVPALPIFKRDFSPGAVYVRPRLRDELGGETIHLDRLAAHYPRAGIAGPPGAGKTSALNFLANGATVLSLAGLPAGALPPDLPDALILLDEVQAAHRDYLARLDRDLPQARVLVGAHDLAGLPANFALLALQPFNEREIRSAVEAWFPEGETAGHGGIKRINRAAEAFIAALKADQRTRLLAINPLNLFLLVQVYAQGTPLPNRRAALFDYYVSTRLQTENDPDLAARALEGIALSTKRGRLAKEEHLSRGYGFLRQRSRPSLGASKAGPVEFVHPLVQDLLVARALRRNPELAPLVEHMLDDDWREVVLFYAGLGDPRTLVEALLERDHLYLAASALAEASEVPDDLHKRIFEPLVKRAWEQEDTGAIAALGALRSNAAIDFFAARLKERDPAARARAAMILGQSGTDRAVEYLLPQLRDTDAGVRDQVVASLGQSKSDRVIEPLLVALRGDSRVGAVDTRMRLASARALGEVGTERAVPALIVDLQIGEPEVRAEAVKALIKIRSDFALKPLRAIVDSNQPVEVRAAAEQVLKSM